MKEKIFALFAVILLALSGGDASAEQKNVPTDGRQNGSGAASEAVHADVKKHLSCPHCGMDREKYASTRMVITFADGSSVGLCSIHCAVIEILANKGKSIRTVEVADIVTNKLIPAEKATWVIGGNKKGVMTANSKWAFAVKDDAAEFVKKNGGRIATYIEALFLARKD
jgi:nitrous oxide reductase accessory protein NosL